MTWTKEYANGYTIRRGAVYDDDLVWLGSSETTGEAAIMQWDGVAGLATEIFLVTTNAADIETANAIFNFVVFDDDIYVAYGDNSGNSKVLKYSGTPLSWTTVDTSAAPSSPVYNCIIFAGADYIYCEVNYAAGTIWRKSADGTTWSAASSTEFAGSEGFWWLRTSDDLIEYYNSGDKIQDITGGGASTIYDLTTNGYNEVDGSSNSYFSAIYANRISDNILMRSENGTSWSATSLYSSASATRMMAAGGRDFLQDNQDTDGIFYFDDSTFTLIEAPPASTTGIKDVVNWGDELWAFFDGASSTYRGWYSHSSFSDWDPISPPITTVHQRGLSLATPLAGGNYYWFLWLNDETIELQKRSVTTGAIIDTISMGTVTNAQIDAGTYSARVVAVDDDLVYVYGLLNDPQSLGAAQIIVTTDGGASWGIVENSWGTEHCGAIFHLSDGTIYAIRNQASGSPRLYKGDWGGVFAVSIITGLPVGATVGQGDLIIDNSLAMYVAVEQAGGRLIARANPPYTNWLDISYDHPDVGINRIVSFQ